MNNREETPKSLTPNMPLWSYQLQGDSRLAVRTRKDLEIYLITRALKDEAFKQDLLINPKAVVEKELGIKLAEDLEINVLEETETTLYMVLPNNPYEGLSETELKASLGMTYDDVAQWVLKQHRNAFLDETSSVMIIARAWRDKAFNEELLHNLNRVLEQELSLLADNISVQIFAETPLAIYIILPYCQIPSLHEVLELQLKNFQENSLLIGGSVGCNAQSKVVVGACNASDSPNSPPT